MNRIEDTKKIRVMILASCHRIGGFETKLDSLIRHMNTDHLSLMLLLVYPYYKAKQMDVDVRNRYKAFLTWKGIHTIEIGMKNRYDFTIIWRVMRILKKNRVDILYFFALGSGTFIAPIAGKLAKVHWIVKEYQTILDGLYPKVLIGVDRFLMDWVDRIVVPSQFLKNMLLKNFKICPDMIDIIPNSIDLLKFGKKEKSADIRAELNMGCDTKLIGIIANLLPVKDHSVLFHAMPNIIKRFPNTFFILIGEGPLKEGLEKLADQLGVTQHVRFLGYRNDVNDLIPLFDVGVLCSKVEIHPNSLLEIMASGVPVVAPSVGGIPEIIEQGENGILVPQGDSERLAEALISLIGNREKAAKYGKNGRRMVFRKYSVDNMVSLTEDLFSTLHSKNSGI